MKYIFPALLLPVFITSMIFAQKGKEETNLSDAIQLDSTEYFLIPQLIDFDSRQVYGKGKGHFPGGYGNVFFYNASTNQTRKLINEGLFLIESFRTRRYYYSIDKEPEMPDNILPQHIVYLVRSENYSGDNALDSDDPLYLFISTRTGDKFRQITPNGYHVESWSVSHNKKMILVRLKSDKNRDRQFGQGDDDVYYRIDLVEDVMSITCKPIGI